MDTFFKYAWPLGLGAAAILGSSSTVVFIISIIGVMGAGGGAVASFKEGEILFGLDLCLAAFLCGVAIFAHFGL